MTTGGTLLAAVALNIRTKPTLHVPEVEFEVMAKLRLIEFEGCQYVYAERDIRGAIAIVHHGACNNPAHQRPQ